MGNSSMYRTGWNVDAEEARSTALSSTKSENVNFDDAVPFECNRAVMRAQQHQRMYERLYAKYRTDENKTVEEFLEEKTDEIIESSAVIDDENENVGESVFGVPEEELVNEGVVFGMPVEEVETEVPEVPGAVETEPVKRGRKKKGSKKTDDKSVKVKTEKVKVEKPKAEKLEKKSAEPKKRGRKAKK